jgi:hypothetical protein
MIRDPKELHAAKSPPPEMRKAFQQLAETPKVRATFVVSFDYY